MKTVIVGNGLAGTMAAKTMRELDPDVEIDIFGEEKYPYYPRPNLIEFLAGNLPCERVFAFSESWHVRQDIRIHAAKPVKRIDLRSRRVETADGGRAGYDRLLLAPGARAAVPPLAGAGKKGVFTLRTLDDALAVLDYLAGRSRTAVVGGGLLGLEAARALKTRGAEVDVVEVFPRLLPRQLDAEGAALLKGQIEKMGIRVRLGTATEEILGNGEARGLRFKGGGELAAEMVILATGAKANLDLAKACGVAAENGVVVDDHLRSSDPAVYAAGDVAQHRGRVYGIIPAAFEQARAAAHNILGRDYPYGGTVPSNSLKVAGVAVTTLGLVNPEGPGYECFSRTDADKGIYRKIVVRGGLLEGAVWMGTKKGVSEISRLAALRANVERWKSSIIEDDFDFSVL